jgi:23S rRNA (guanosine2251-2'-O)-methyltransferase
MKKPAPKSSRSKPTRPHGAPVRPATDWLSGLHSVHEALRAGRRRIDRLFVREVGRHGEQESLIELARSSGIPIEAVDDRTLDRFAGPEVRSQGVVLQVGPLPELSLDALIAELAASDAASGRRLVVLDGVEDPQNVGAIARVAESAGCAGLILTDRRAPGLTPTVSRASAGAIEWLPVARVTNLVRTLEKLKKERYWILAADLEQSEPLYSLSDRVLTGDLVIVLGAEGHGIRPGVLEQADHRIRIPMLGEVASLNVATAGAVILYELLRRAEVGGG